jgi:hypothetical protein
MNNAGAAFEKKFSTAPKNP